MSCLLTRLLLLEGGYCHLLADVCWLSVGCAPRFWEVLLDYWLCMILIDFEVNLVDLKKVSLAFFAFGYVDNYAV
jgi:hypothetical protein